MFLPASTITIISSVWSLTVDCKILIEGIRNSEKRINELDRKATSFATLIYQVANAYRSDATGPDDFSTSPPGKQLRKDIQNELSRCEEDIEAYKREVSKLRGQRKTGRYGVQWILNTWREKVANPTIERIENSIKVHQSHLQSLMEVHHG